MSEEAVRVLIVDDTVTYRKVLNDLLATVPGVEVVGTASNGKLALQKIEQLRPDLLTLDFEMPEMNGLEVLRHLRAAGSPVGAIMLSAFTTDGANETITALGLGAFDFVVKPSTCNAEESLKALRADLCPKILAFARNLSVRSALSRRPPATVPPPRPPSPVSQNASQRTPRIVSRLPVRPEVVALGISTGGPPALARMLPGLPGDLAAPLLIVQHMPPKFTKSLADDLNRRCPLAVSEASDEQPVVPGHVLLAPGGRHMKIERRADGLVARVADDPPENNCRPSVDYLFRSVAHACGQSALGVIMTGMGNDGTLGCRLMKRNGAAIITQNEASCVVYGMPKAPAEEGLSDAVVPLDRIASEITRLVGKGVPACR